MAYEVFYATVLNVWALFQKLGIKQFDNFEMFCV